MALLKRPAEMYGFSALRELLQWKTERVPRTRQLSCERTSLFQVLGRNGTVFATDCRRQFLSCVGRPGDRLRIFQVPLPFDDSSGGHRQRTAASANIRLRWNYRPDSDLYVIYTAGQKFASLEAVSPAQFYENRFGHQVHILLATVR